jgi:adenosylmethionine-8-amino-7-oxononanoate aminotransferase
MMTLAKGIASGYVPLGAVAVSDAIFEPFADPSNPDNGFYHGNTYAGHAACCAAALANIDIIEREGLVERSAVEGVWFHELLLGLADEFELVREVRGGLGIVAGVQLGAPVAQAVARGAYERGVLVRPLTGDVLTLSPPLVITRPEMERVHEALRGALAEVAASPRDRELASTP